MIVNKQKCPCKNRKNCQKLILRVLWSFTGKKTYSRPIIFVGRRYSFDMERQIFCLKMTYFRYLNNHSFNWKKLKHQIIKYITNKEKNLDINDLGHKVLSQSNNLVRGSTQNFSKLLMTTFGINWSARAARALPREYFLNLAPADPAT